MQKKKSTETGRFKARDANGKEFVVVETSNYLEGGGLISTSEEWNFLNKSYKTSDGELLEEQDDGSFVFVKTGRKLTRK